MTIIFISLFGGSKKVVPFEVNSGNFWVAVHGMISKIVKTGVRVSRKNTIVDMDLNCMKEYQKLVLPGLGGTNSNMDYCDFIKSMNICYVACNDKMVEIALKYKKWGVFMVAKDIKQQTALFEKLVEKEVNKNDIFVIKKNHSLNLVDKLVENGEVPDYKIVITTIMKSAGYNLSRLRIMITSVYPSNNATRMQLEGRINRMDQHSNRIWYYTVHTGVLTNILERHKDSHNLMSVFKSIAEEIKFQKE